MRWVPKNKNCFLTSNGDALLHLLIRAGNIQDIRILKFLIDPQLFRQMVKVTNDKGANIYDLISEPLDRKKAELTTSKDKTKLTAEVAQIEKERNKIFQFLIDDMRQNDLKKISDPMNPNDIIEQFNLSLSPEHCAVISEACRIANIVKSRIKITSTHPENNGLLATVSNNVSNILLKRQVMENLMLSGKYNDFFSCLSIYTEYFLTEGVGNGREVAYFVFKLLSKYSSTLYHIKNGNRFFQVFEPNGLAVICDPWMGQVYPLNAIAQQLLVQRHFSYQKGKEEMALYWTNTFNPNYHVVEPALLFDKQTPITDVPSNVLSCPFASDFLLTSFAWQPSLTLEEDFLNALHENDRSVVIFLFCTSYGQLFLRRHADVLDAAVAKINSDLVATVICWLLQTVPGRTLLWHSSQLRNLFTLNVLKERVPLLNKSYILKMSAVDFLERAENTEIVARLNHGLVTELINYWRTKGVFYTRTLFGTLFDLVPSLNAGYQLGKPRCIPKLRYLATDMLAKQGIFKMGLPHCTLREIIQQRLLPVFMQAVIDDDRNTIIALLNKNPELVLIKAKPGLHIQSQYSWVIFDVTDENALSIAVKRNQIKMVELLLTYYGRLTQTDNVIRNKREGLSAGRLYSIKENENGKDEMIIPADYSTYATFLIDCLRQETYSDTKNRNLSQQTTLMLTSFFELLLPEKAVKLDKYLDPVLLLLALYKSYYYMVRNMRNPGLRDTFWVNIIGLTQSVLPAETAKSFCAGLLYVVTEKRKINARAESLTLRCGEPFFRRSRTTLVGMANEYMCNLGGFATNACAQWLHDDNILEQFCLANTERLRQLYYQHIIDHPSYGCSIL